MDRELKQTAYFRYEDEKAILSVRYDAEANEVVISGGRHGYACFAELCSMNAELDAPDKSYHWFEASPGEHAFTIVLQNSLAKG